MSKFNRRSLFTGAAASTTLLPVVSFADDYDGKAYGNQCGECLQIMWISVSERLDGTKIDDGIPRMECANKNCSQHGIAYRYPLTKLERV